jgi:hypothetical protein
MHNAFGCFYDPCKIIVALHYVLSKLLSMEDFISLFLKMLFYLKYFKTINKIISKIDDFILYFHNTKFYVVS